MARDPFELMMSRMLDNDLTEEEEAHLHVQLTQDSGLADSWEDLRLIDSMLSQQAELAPPVDFTARVMTRIDNYETQKRWYPWLVVLVILVTIAAVGGFMLPWLAMGGLLQPIVADWPIVGTLLVGLANVTNAAVTVATLFTTFLTTWIRVMTSEPVVLGVVVSALVIASTYIGLREGHRLYSIALLESA